MSPTVWYFLRSESGCFRPMPLAKMERFFHGQEALPAAADGFVRYAELVVYLHERRAVEVTRVGFFKCRVRADGTLDPEHQWNLQVASIESASGIAFPLLGEEPGVVRAEHKLARPARAPSILASGSPPARSGRRCGGSSTRRLASESCNELLPPT